MAKLKIKEVKDEEEISLGRLSRLGFKRVSDCLMVVPKEYRDYTNPITVINHGMIGMTCYFILRLNKIELFDSNKNPTNNWRDVARVQIEAIDDYGKPARITVFGLVFPWLKIKQGEDIHFYGTMDSWNRFLQFNSPSIVENFERGRVIPLYRGKVGQVSGNLVRDGVHMAMPFIDESGCDLLADLGMREAEFSKETGIKLATDLLKSIHMPRTVEEGDRSVELAKRLTARAILKRAETNKAKTIIKDSVIAINRDYVQKLIGMLPYPLTDDQSTAIKEVVNDLRSAYAMNRLLSGDVGTGKSLTFMIPAVAAQKAGARVGIIVPSQLLVTQMSRELREFFPGVDVCEVVSGGSVGTGIAIGTTALLSASAKKKIEFDFIICDEQHKFSVAQKNALIKTKTNLLESTATAIPRTLAIVNFGGMDLSVLRKCPVKKVIESRIVIGDERERLFNFVENVFEKNAQVAIILPLVEDQEEAIVKGRLQSVREATVEWTARFPGRRIDVLTGKMTNDEKNAAIAKMHSKETDLLISTVVIETGVTLPSLRALIVIHPERFGVSQLHQLRGRVARKGGKGYFFMFCPSEIEEDAQERLHLLTKFSDGFEIAEHDMNIRGFGDIDMVSATQTGATRMLFWGVKITKNDIQEEAKNSSLAMI